MPPKAKYLLDNFLLTLEEWNKIYKFQKGRCGVCKKKLKKTISTDHHHKTGQILGLLCFRCNSAIREYFTVELVGAIWRYLKDPPATKALGREHFGLVGRIGTKKRRRLIKKLKKEKK